MIPEWTHGLGDSHTQNSIIGFIELITTTIPTLAKGGQSPVYHSAGSADGMSKGIDSGRVRADDKNRVTRPRRVRTVPTGHIDRSVDEQLPSSGGTVRATVQPATASTPPNRYTVRAGSARSDPILPSVGPQLTLGSLYHPTTYRLSPDDGDTHGHSRAVSMSGIASQVHLETSKATHDGPTATVMPIRRLLMSRQPCDSG